MEQARVEQRRDDAEQQRGRPAEIGSSQCASAATARMVTSATAVPASRPGAAYGAADAR
jgi:hypothetical protein